MFANCWKFALVSHYKLNFKDSVSIITLEYFSLIQMKPKKVLDGKEEKEDGKKFVWKICSCFGIQFTLSLSPISKKKNLESKNSCCLFIIIHCLLLSNLINLLWKKRWNTRRQIKS